jgi:hypothetical protein
MATAIVAHQAASAKRKAFVTAWRQNNMEEMDTIALDPRLRHAAGFLGCTAGMLIDGKLVSAVSGKTFPVYDPATGTCHRKRSGSRQGRR